MNILLSGSIIGGCSYLVIRVMMKIDPEHGMYFSKKHKLLLVLGSVASALVCKFLVKEEMSLLFAGWIGVHIYFMIASMTDSMTCKVYDVFQYRTIHSLPPPKNTDLQVCLVFYPSPGSVSSMPKNREAPQNCPRCSD